MNSKNHKVPHYAIFSSLLLSFINIREHNEPMFFPFCNCERPSFTLIQVKQQAVTVLHILIFVLDSMQDDLKILDYACKHSLNLVRS